MDTKTILKNHPAIENHTIISTDVDLQIFFSRLTYTPERLMEMGVKKDFEEWIVESDEKNLRFYVMIEEPNNPRNDHWGNFLLWKAVACLKKNGEYEILKGTLVVFSR